MFEKHQRQTDKENFNTSLFFRSTLHSPKQHVFDKNYTLNNNYCYYFCCYNDLSALNFPKSDDCVGHCISVNDLQFGKQRNQVMCSRFIFAK